ncbi:SIS domain-containing protein [Streptomyces sp. NPDC059814]|uniref:SIS domain-containing protein n=1 Tax=Streptomyces sp. NPDC059814 TaxID=3346959 RepID=UPI003651F21E
MSAVPEGAIPYRAGRAAQPAALDRIAARVAGQLALGETLSGVREPVFVGIGASHAALALPVRVLAQDGIAARRELAGDLGPGPAFARADLVLGVSQSGRSTETLEALSLVERERRAALVNIAPSPLSGTAAHCIDLGSEPDSYASTVGYTGTLVGLTMTARALAGRPLPQISAEWAGIGELLERHERAVGPVVDEVAGRAAAAVAADVVASGAALSASEAGALLLREVCRVPATAAVTRNYLHGAMESAGHTLHIVIGDGREIELARTLAAAGHPTLAVTSAPLTGGGQLYVARVPDTVSLPVRTVLETVVLQRLAAALADARGVEIEDFVFHNADTKTAEPVA